MEVKRTIYEEHLLLGRWEALDSTIVGLFQAVLGDRFNSFTNVKKSSCETVDSPSLSNWNALCIELERFCAVFLVSSLSAVPSFSPTTALLAYTEQEDNTTRSISCSHWEDCFRGLLSNTDLGSVLER
eukprot:6484186-Amphidinium_carterae.1